MKPLKTICALAGLLVTLPITFYLQYQIMQRVQASELMWFLFWVNLPLVVTMSTILKLADKD